MNSQSIKQFSIFSAMGLSSLLLIGYAVGLYTNPVINTLENQDLKRDLADTSEHLEHKHKETEAKQELVDSFIKDYKELGRKNYD